MESLVVHNQLLDDDANIAALNGTIQGRYGLQVVCIGDIELTDRALGFDKLHTNPDSTNFYGYWFCANLTKRFQENKRFSGLVARLGFSATEEVHDGRRMAITTSPAGSEYLNNALDEQSGNGFRFYDYDLEAGEIVGSDFLRGIADGYAPVAPFGTGLFRHDMFDHVLGYAMLGDRATRRMMSIARRAIDNGLDMHPSGELIYGTESSNAAQLIDDVSGELTRPLAYGNSRFDFSTRIRLTMATRQLAFNGRV